MNRPNRMAFTNVTQMLFDIFNTLFSFVITWQLLRFYYVIPMMAEYTWILFLFGIMSFFMMINQNMYSRSNFRYRDRIIRDITFSSLIASLACMVILPKIIAVPYMQKFLGFYIVIYTILQIILWNITTTVVVRQLRKSIQHTLIVGDLESIEKFLYFLKKTSFHESPIGYVSTECGIKDGKIPCLGVIEDLEDIIGNNIVDEVVFAMPHTFVGRVEKYMEICEIRGLTVKIALEFTQMAHLKRAITSIGPIPIIAYHTVSLNEMQLLLKRVMDIAGAAVGLFITALLAIFIIPAIKLDSPGPVIFKQKRMGKNGRDFMFYKFRSMCTDAEYLKEGLKKHNEVADGMMFKIKNDPRITRVGAFLRKTSLDELPQFMNILKGDMSLVGTRPPTMDEVMKYANFHHRRISIKPGLTGLWQVSGRSKIKDFNEVVNLDVQYIDQWSVWKDISIILRTVLTLIARKQDAY